MQQGSTATRRGPVAFLACQGNTATARVANVQTAAQELMLRRHPTDASTAKVDITQKEYHLSAVCVLQANIATGRAANAQYAYQGPMPKHHPANVLTVLLDTTLNKSEWEAALHAFPDFTRRRQKQQPATAALKRPTRAEMDRYQSWNVSAQQGSFFIGKATMISAGHAWMEATAKKDQHYDRFEDCRIIGERQTTHSRLSIVTVPFLAHVLAGASIHPETTSAWKGMQE